jgi:hypothetical protein
VFEFFKGMIALRKSRHAALVPDGHRLPEIFADNARELYRAVTGKDATPDAQPILP